LGQDAPLFSYLTKKTIMKNFKRLALSLLFSIGFVFPGCNGGYPDCNCPESTYFDINGLDLHFSDVNAYPVVSTDSIEFSDFDLMTVDYLVDYHVNLQTRQDWSFSLMNTANACSCPTGGSKGSKTEKLTALSLITINDFDADHLAGSEINDLLDYVGNRSEISSLASTLEEYISNQTGKILEEENLLLKLTKAPDSNTPFQVKITMELSTKEKYEVTSPAIVFK